MGSGLLTGVIVIVFAFRLFIIAYAARVWTDTTDVGERVLTTVVNGYRVIPLAVELGPKYMPPFSVDSYSFFG